MKNSSLFLIGIFIVITIVIMFFVMNLFKRPVMEEEIDCVTACNRNNGEQAMCTDICPSDFIELGTHKCEPPYDKCCCFISKPTSVTVNCKTICSGYPYNELIGIETVLTCQEYCDAECSDWNEECSSSEQRNECCCYSCV